MNYWYHLQQLIGLETINDHTSPTDDNYNGSDHGNNIPKIDEDIETEIKILLDLFSHDIKHNDELLPNDIDTYTPIFALFDDTVLKMGGIENNSDRKDIMNL
eukprot:449572_1